jgi:hypothetical protein
MKGTPPGSIQVCSPSGWIQSEILFQWFIHLIKHTKLSKEDPVILVLDGHYSHTRNLEVITLVRENHASHLTAATKCNPWIKLSWGPWKHSTANKLKNGSVQTQGESTPSTKLALHTSGLQQARQRLMTSERQVSFLVTRTSSDNMLSLCPQKTHILLLWTTLLR